MGSIKSRMRFSKWLWTGWRRSGLTWCVRSLFNLSLLLTHPRPRTYRNQILPCRQKILPALSVTTPKEKTRTRSYSATDAT